MLLNELQRQRQDFQREVAELRALVGQRRGTEASTSATAEQTNVAWLYRLLNGQAPSLDESLMARLRMAPGVPTTSIFSRSDGIVAWQACIQDGGGNHTENIEIDGSHVGMTWNPQVLAVIADRLRRAN